MYNIKELELRKHELSKSMEALERQYQDNDTEGYYSVNLAQEELLSSMAKLDKELRDLDYIIFKVKAVLEANKDP